MLRVVLGLLAMALPSTAFAADIRDLPKEEYVVQVLNVVDTVQTIDILNRGGREFNPIIGSHPSTQKVILLKTVGGVAHVATTLYLMDHHKRLVKPWEYISITLLGSAVALNMRYTF